MNQPFAKRSHGAAGIPHSPSRRDVLRLAGLTGLGLLAPGLFSGCGRNLDDSLPGFSATIADSRAAILKAMADSDTTTVSAALIDRDRIVWSEAFGVIDKVTRAAPTTSTMFAIGSVSKVIAAIATMILVDRRLVELDAPFVRYVTDFRMLSPEYTQVTVRMLLSHSSGFPGTEGLSIFTFHTPEPDYARQTLQTLAASHLKHAPGELAVYCNDGFTMIELLVHAVAGKPYAQFVNDEILVPLGMRNSRYTLANFEPGTYAPPYRGDAKQPQELINAQATGGLYSTPSDMGRLAMMLMNRGQVDGVRILSEESVAEMARDQTARLPFNPVSTFKYGLGWDGVAQPGLAAAGVTTWHKNGGTTFYGSEFYVSPTERLAVMITGNTRAYGSGKLAEFILLRALAERGSIAAVPAPLPGTPLPESPATDADLAAMTGIFGRYDATQRMEAQPDRTLTLSSYTGGGWQPIATGLKLRNDGTWSSDAAPGSAFRALEAAGRRYLVRRVIAGHGHYRLDLPHAQRMLPGQPISAAWQARLGRKWLVVNENPNATEIPVDISLDAVPELPGYVLMSGTVVDPAGSDTVARMCLKISMEAGRDLNDAVIETRNGEEWLRAGSYLARPLASVLAFSAGSHAVAIGGEGLSEWRRLPASGTVSISGGTAWRLYDAQFELLAAGGTSGIAALSGSGEASYLQVYGAPGSAVAVTVAA